MTHENGSEEKIQKVFRSDIALAATIVVATVAVLGFFFSRVNAIADRVTKIEITQDAGQKVLDAVTNLRDNHIHTIESEVADLAGEVQTLKEGQTRIETILNERLPAKK